MTIFNNSSRDTEPLIISNLPHQDQVVLSGVNRTTYTMLSNKTYFYNLFVSKYCSFETGEKRLEKQLEVFCNRHPSNCWKVACCVLQTGRMNFSPSFLNEEILHLMGEKSKCESRIKEIWGNYNKDPSSPIHQAWLAYQDQQGICNLFHKQALGIHTTLFTQIVIDTGREAEFRSLGTDSMSLEEILPAAEKFDKRLIPLVLFSQDYRNAQKKAGGLYGEYIQLENERQLNVVSIKAIDSDLNKIETSHCPLVFQKANVATMLNQHLENLIASPHATSDDAYKACKAWANIEFPKRILDALVVQLKNNPGITRFQSQSVTENIISDAIEGYASQAIEDLQKNFKIYKNEVANFFAALPEEFIERQLLEAIEKKHGVRFNPNQN